MNNNPEKIPVFKSWTHWYVLVIAFLIILILLFNSFTGFFA
jgi:hypothetical protein